MLQDCVDATNTTTAQMERVMSEGGCQESQSTHNWKNTKAAGVKTQEIRKSDPGIKYIEEWIHRTTN